MNTMERTYLLLSNKNRIKLPEELVPEDNRFSESFVEHFMEKYSKPGDNVLDPFAGLGTTLFVAEEMGRMPYGIEYDKAKVEFIKSKIKNKQNIINGDTTRFSSYKLPMFSLCITSPPYMEYDDEKNPFTDYSQPGNGYESYLKTLKEVFSQVKQKMEKGGHIVLDISNLKNKDKIVTPLAWDVGKLLSEVFLFEGETIICWKEGYDYGYDHSYALVYKNI